jgi:phytoene dehydrogenase-like protein
MHRNYDVIIIGAGHNGLAAAATLARRGVRTLNLEKNGYVGGMAGSREILKGCRNDVGATMLFPLSKEIIEELEFEKYGAEFIDLPIMTVNLNEPGSPPLVLYPNPLKMSWHMLRSFGPAAMLGFIRLMLFIRYPAKMLDRFTPRSTPRDVEQLLAEAPNAQAREQLMLAFEGSAMDIIERFFPDKEKHRTLRAMLCFAAIQSTYKGPFTKGSAMCLIYTLAMNENGGLMRRVKGGMGSLSEAVARSVEAHGGEIRLKTAVQRILVEDGRAVGVELKGGEQLRARVILSNLDKHATFFRLLGEEHLSDEFSSRIREVENRGAYIHMTFKLHERPTFGGAWSMLNDDPNAAFGLALVPDPEQMQADYDACRRGELPARPPVALQIGSVVDPSIAPEGFDCASCYGFYFPCEAPKAERGKLRDEMAERVLDRIEEYLPRFRECIAEKAVFSSDHFATMQGATHGDFTHGLIHPNQMLGYRASIEGSAHKTPIDGLYLCGAACHPGPGVTFLPGYGCAHEVLEELGRASA